MSREIRRQKPHNAGIGVVIYQVRAVNGHFIASTGPSAIRVSHNSHVTAAWMEGWIGLASPVINQSVSHTLSTDQLRISKLNHMHWTDRDHGVLPDISLSFSFLYIHMCFLCVCERVLLEESDAFCWALACHHTWFNNPSWTEGGKCRRQVNTSSGSIKRVGQPVPAAMRRFFLTHMIIFFVQTLSVFFI